MNKKKILPPLDAQAGAGTPAFQEYLRNSGYQREFLDLQSALHKRMAEIEAALPAPLIFGKLCAKNSASFDLRQAIEKLAEPPVDGPSLLHWLALDVALQEKRQGRAYWLLEMRRSKIQHRRLAAMLREVAHEVERVYSSPQSHPEIWNIALQKPHDGPVIPEGERVPKQWVAQTLALADDLDAKARGLGGLGKSEYPRFKRGARPALVFALHPVLKGDEPGVEPSMPHFQALACLMAEAYRQFAITAKPPSADSLRLTYNRRAWLRR